MAVCAAVAYIALLAAFVVAAKHATDGAADLAALSGAAGVQDGSDGCVIAELIAVRDGVSLDTCRRIGEDVVVTVRREVRLPLGLTSVVRASARAGP